MAQFLSINLFLGFLQFLLGFSKVPVFLCHSVYIYIYIYIYIIYIYIPTPPHPTPLNFTVSCLLYCEMASSIGA